MCLAPSPSGLHTEARMFPIFALDAGVPISEVTMVTTGNKPALQCGGMNLAWPELQQRLPNEHTWNNWVSRWTAAFTKARDISRLTSSDTTAMAQNTMVESVVATNQQHARTISDLTGATAAI